MNKRLSIPDGYSDFLTELKQRIGTAQVKAAQSVNCELVLLYWQIGKDILERQNNQGWGAKVIDQLSKDLRKSFPEMKGLSPRNLKYMRSFANAWPEKPIVQAALAQITWYHNLALLEKVKSPEQRLWYVQQTIENGWSRNVLVHQIDSNLYARQGKAISNFKHKVLLQKAFNFIGVIDEHRKWDRLNPDPRWPLGRHQDEISDLENGLGRCWRIYDRKCRKKKKKKPTNPCPVPVPVLIPKPAPNPAVNPRVSPVGPGVAPNPSTIPSPRSDIEWWRRFRWRLRTLPLRIFPLMPYNPDDMFRDRNPPPIAYCIAIGKCPLA